MKKQITREEYISLTGLMALAKAHYEQLKLVEKTAEVILGMEDVGQHCSAVSDAIYGDENFCAKDLCRNMQIKIGK